MRLAGIVLAMLPSLLVAQTGEYSLRSSVNMEVKIAKNLKLELTPEYRFESDPGVGSALLQTGLNYKVAGWLSLGGYYRLEAVKVSSAESTDGSTFDLSNRFAFDANGKIRIKRFTPKARIRFSNFTDFDAGTIDKSNYLRYRAGLDYNIRGVKLTPYASVEFYQKLSSGLFSKTRFTLGGEYTFNKHNSLAAEYSLARKFKSATNYHIFELTYKVNF